MGWTIATILLTIITTILGFALFNLLKKNEVLEDFINKVEDNDGVDKKRSNAQVELLKLKLERDGIR